MIAILHGFKVYTWNYCCLITVVICIVSHKDIKIIITLSFGVATVVVTSWPSSLRISLQSPIEGAYQGFLKFLNAMQFIVQSKTV